MEDTIENNAVSKIERSPLVELQERKGVPRTFLEEMFTDPKFFTNIRSMSTHAIAHKAESGFIVKKKNGHPQISRVIKSSPDTNESALSVNFGDIMFEKHSVKIRPNIIFRIHSHPLAFEESDLNAILRPSDGDLHEGWETMSAKEPFVIDSILTTDGKKAHLFLYQRDPNKPFIDYYSQWSDRESFLKLRHLMNDSGIRYSFVDLDLKEGKFQDNQLEKLYSFATE